MAARLGFFPLRAPVRVISSGRISSTGSSFDLAAQQHVPVIARGSQPWFSLRAAAFGHSRVESESVHLVDGKDDAAMRGIGFDLAAP